MNTYEFRSEQFLPRPVHDVFAFFSDAGNLEAITPAWLQFRILTPRPIEMRVGTLIDYTLKLYGVPVQWQTRIESFDPPREFVDIQVRGPYRAWRHTHRFEPANGGTRMTDVVRYAIGWGPLGPIAHALFVRRSIAAIFEHRRREIERLLAPASAGMSNKS